MGVRAVEHDPSCLVLVEAELDEGTHGAAALRGAVDEGGVYEPGDRVRITVVVYGLVREEGDQVADGGEAEPEN